MICPACRRAFADPDIHFCVEDGTALVTAAPAAAASPEIRRSTAQPTRELGVVVEGRYSIRGLLGEGGMGRVYLAEDIDTRRQVALKILRREQTGNRLSRERFLREVDVAAQLVHPSVCRILGAGERQDRAPYLVLELLEGEPLGAVLDRERVFAEPYALELTREAASALSAAHLAGVVHRDVKPENLFLTLDNKLKVMDFGFAKLKETSVTATGMTMGTVPYMAPEQALADPVDGRTDVYGLGVTLFHMLTGSLPFDDPDDARLVAAHLYTPPPRPSALRPGLDPRVDRVVAAALRKRPDNRYASMAALLEDLERLLGRRDGDIGAPEPALVPDVYEPRNPMSRAAARFLRGLVDAPVRQEPP
jgi:eukaryotic-like serine/threonine-protein kinase